MNGQPNNSMGQICWQILHFNSQTEVMARADPKYFDLLDEMDKEEYRRLRFELNKKTERRRRGRRLEVLGECLELVRVWAQRGCDSDWKRCLVSGLCFMTSGVAINLHQIQLLINKCKSSLNGALKLMGFTTTYARGDLSCELINTFPILEGNQKGLREWSIRKPINYRKDVSEAGMTSQSKCPSTYSDHKVVISEEFDDYEEDITSEWADSIEDYFFEC